MKRTKIVATLGPASSSDEKLLELLWAGVNVFRVNFSHGDPEEHRLLIRRIRKVLEDNNMTAAILADLQGPKLRVGVVEEGAVVAPGDRVVFTNHKCEGTKERVYMTYQDFPKDVKAGVRILLDDGKLMMQVVSTNGVDEVVAVVVHGGPLKSKKGVNLPNTHVSLPCLTEKDLVDLHVALDEKVEWIGLSFVRNAEDILALRKIIDSRKSNAGIVAKMEKPEAVADCDRILAATDAIMVARGDLGVEVPMESVPLIQKMLTQKAIALSKPVIVATQMMETMIESMTPTRAEVNDVANSVLDGADAVMLSGETAAGRHPFESVRAMRRIAQEAERWTAAQPPAPLRAIALAESPEPAAVLARAIAQMAADARARAIVCWTDARSVRFISQADVQVPVIAFGNDDAELRSLALLRGVHAIRTRHPADSRDFVRRAETLLRSAGMLAAEDRIVVATGFAGHGTERLWLRRVGERTI